MTCGHATRCATCTCKDTPKPTGADLRDAALEQHEDRHGAFIRNTQRAFLRVLLDAPEGTATFDPLRDAVDLPDDIHPATFGAVPRMLAGAGCIEHAGYAPSRRRVRHAGITSVWRLRSRTLALRWLEYHKPIALPDPEPGPVQGDLFNGNEKPGAGTPGGNN